MASAYQMLGAIRMSIFETAMTREPFKTFTQATHYTPYDSSVYLLRAVSSLGQPDMTKGAIDDLEKALELDDRHRDARTLASALEAIASGQARLLVNRRTYLYQYLREIQSLTRKYAIPQGPTKLRFSSSD